MTTKRVKIDNINEYSDNLINANISGNAATATTAGTCTGNAATATKATQDGNGNNIVNTYMTKTGIFWFYNKWLYN